MFTSITYYKKQDFTTLHFRMRLGTQAPTSPVGALVGTKLNHTFRTQFPDFPRIVLTSFLRPGSLRHRVPSPHSVAHRGVVTTERGPLASSTYASQGAAAGGLSRGGSFRRAGKAGLLIAATNEDHRPPEEAAFIDEFSPETKRSCPHFPSPAVPPGPHIGPPGEGI